MFCTIEDAWGITNPSDRDVLYPSTASRELQSSNNISKPSGFRLDTNKEKIFQQSDKPESFKSIEHFGPDGQDSLEQNFDEPLNRLGDTTHLNSSKEEMYNKYMELKEMFGNEQKETKESEVCIALDNHLSKCHRCRSKYIKYNNENRNSYDFDFSKIMLNIRSNKDMITIFLFGLLIILLLQLFSSK